MNEFPLFICLAAFIISLFVGLLTGVFGVGGGFVLTPALMILLHIPGNIAVGTGLVIFFFNCTLGIIKRRGSGTIDIKLALWLAGGGIIGARIGLWCMSLLKTMPTFNLLGKVHDPVQVILLSLFFLLLLWLVCFMTGDLKKNKGKKLDTRTGLFSKVKIGPYVHFNSLDVPRMSLVPIVGYGVGAGILTALMGIGGGVVMLPALIYLIGQRTVKAAGTSLLFVWVVSIFAGSGHLLQGNIDPVLFSGMLIGGFIGTYLGTHLGLNLQGEKIRQYFVYVVMAAGVMVATKLILMFFLGSASTVR
jgi:hypothetical protein